MPREGKLVRLYVSLGHHSQTLSKDPVDSIICRQITETAEKILYPYSLEAAHCEWSSIYRARQQIATSFSRWNRVFLVGDAVRRYLIRSHLTAHQPNFTRCAFTKDRTRNEYEHPGW